MRAPKHGMLYFTIFIMAAQQGDLHIVFNFFQKIQKPPEQESYLDGMKYVFEYVRKQPSFALGQLHKNIDPNGTYPYVNYVGFNNGEFTLFQPGRPNDEWIQTTLKGVGPRGHQVALPGIYAELSTLSGKPMCTEAPKDESCCYLLLSYQESDVGESNFGAFEADWKTRAGVTILTDCAANTDVKFGDIGLYRRRRPGITPFMYVVRCEVLPGAPVDKVLELLPTFRERLTEAGVPVNDVAAYKVHYLCEPKK